MSQNLTNLIATLAGQALSMGLAAFIWQFFQKKLEKIQDLERRLHRLEVREEMRREFGMDKPCQEGQHTIPPRPTTTPQKPHENH